MDIKVSSNESSESVLKSGTTLVGILGKDYVILASDKQSSMGHLVSSTTVEKLRVISPKIALAAAGGVGDIHQITRVLKAEAKLYESERGKDISVKALTTFLSNVLNANRYYPYHTGIILGGYVNEPELYSTDVVGGISKITEYEAVGSGGELAMGTLEHNYKPNMSKDEAIKLAVSAVNSARKRDVYSGGIGIDVYVMTKSGMEKLLK